MNKLLNNWIRSDKNKFSIFICGDYGVGKTYFVNQCLKKDNDNIEIFKPNII